MTEQELIARLIQCGFSEAQARLGILCGFRCEYCGVDLLESILTYDTWQWDHIDPRAKGGSDDESNGAIACQLCNKIKRAFRYEKSIQEIGRAAYIKEVRKFVAEGRQKKTDNLNAVRAAVGSAFQGHSRKQSAS